jgi:hypothetical protein
MSLPLLVLLVATAGATRRSTVHVGDWAPMDLASIERFCKRYDRVDGDLVLAGDFRGTDLKGLSCLMGVSGDIRAEGAPLLRSLDGLERLAQASQLDLAGVRLRSNPVLHDLGALGRLGDRQLRDLEVVANPQLVEIAALPPLVRGGSLRVVDNPLLEGISAQDASSARSALAEVRVAGNPRLHSLVGLGRTEAIGRLSLQDLPALQRLELLPALRSAEEIDLVGLPAVTALPDWERLALVGAFRLRGLSALTQLPVLPDLSRIKGLEIVGNEGLVDISGLVANRATPPTVYGLRIQDNPGLDPLGLAQTLSRVQLPVDARGWQISNNGPPVAPAAP